MDTCKDLKVIPQYPDVGICWFNSILMALLYSENSRKMLIRNSITWDKENKFLNILKHILKNYDKPLIEDYYKHMQPQIILFQFFKSFNLYRTKGLFLKLNKKKINLFSFFNEYITFILSKINPKTLDITYDSNTKTKIIGIQEYIAYELNKDGKIQFDLPNNFPESRAKDKINDIIEKNPDFIILYHSDLGNKIPIELYNDFKSKIFDLSTYNNITSDGIEEYKDIITFNGVKYKLDSCLISNFNDPRHSIVGITCNGNRYVYNGWLSVNNSPCPLIKYDWNLRNDGDFCLNTKKCKLGNKDDRDLCFSFAKGQRILVYVRILDELSSLNNKKIELSNSIEFLKDMYSIDYLTEDEIKEHLLYFILPKYKGTNKEDLKSFLDEEFKKSNIDELRHELLNYILMAYHNPIKEKSLSFDLTEAYLKEFIKKNRKPFFSISLTYRNQFII